MTIYFTITRLPYTHPIALKRSNTTWDDVIKEFPDAVLLMMI